MNILHYSLGFPPFRRGGMTQYCLDLMIEQAKVGHQVGLLWPGRLYDLTPKSKVNQKQKYKLQNDLYCTSYELLNPLPIPLMDGIQNPAMYLVKKEKKVYTEFFQKHTFQVFHIQHIGILGLFYLTTILSSSKTLSTGIMLAELISRALGFRQMHVSNGKKEQKSSCGMNWKMLWAVQTFMR